MATSASAAIFGPFLRALTWFYDNRRAATIEEKAERRRAYKEHFEPAYKLLEEVHRNYLDSFHEFYTLCSKFETPPAELVEKFRSMGLKYSGWRTDLRHFSRIVRELGKSFQKPEQKQAIENFRIALVEYFNVALPEGDAGHWPSWFTFFIDTFESLIREGKSPWEYDYRIAIEAPEDPKVTFMNRLRSAYKTELPARWDAVAEAKAKLQAVFNV